MLLLATAGLFNTTEEQSPSPEVVAEHAREALYARSKCRALQSNDKQEACSPQKNRYTPHSIEQSMVRKDWPMRKVKSMLTVTLMDWPAERVSRG